jgi:putative phosphoesterase
LRRVAVIADVHGNAPAFAAVLEELEREQPDLIVSCGDLTWGPLPEETHELARELNARWVRGNADRAVLEGVSESERERWMQAHHTDAMRDFLGKFEENVVVEVDGLGAVRFCHGSPRSDEELITPRTPDERMTALLEQVDERVLICAHTHIQFDRRVVGIRSINPGSVGMPYETDPGAYWALLGPDVELRRTEYALGAAVSACRASGDPLAEEIAETLLAPPTPDEVIAAAETLRCSG